MRLFNRTKNGCNLYFDVIENKPGSLGLLIKINGYSHIIINNKIADTFTDPHEAKEALEGFVKQVGSVNELLELCD